MTNNGHDQPPANGQPAGPPHDPPEPEPEPTPIDRLRDTLAHVRTTATDPEAIETLQDTAEAWAVYCLRTHHEAALMTGLAISVALVTYITALQDLQDAVDAS